MGPAGNHTADAALPTPSEALQVPDDLQLVQQIARGDEAAFRALVDRQAPYLYGIAHALTGQAADAEDVVQETLAVLLKGGFRGEASVRTWLVGVLVRRVAMLRRAGRRRKAVLSLDGALGREQEVAATDSSLVVEAGLDLTTMLQSLSPDHRAVLVLRELQGMTYDEMAEVLGVPRGTVESRLHRAREEMRRRYKGYLED